jgi:hypothetical protein
MNKKHEGVQGELEPLPGFDDDARPTVDGIEAVAKVGAPKLTLGELRAMERIQPVAGDLAGIERLRVEVRKAGPYEWFRTHPQWSWGTMLLKRDREFFMLHRRFWPEFSDNLAQYRLTAAVTSGGAYLLVPTRIYSSGTPDGWTQTMVAALERAKDRWVRVSSDQGIGHYRVREAIDNLGEPTFPDIEFEEYLLTAFEARYVTDDNDEIIRNLRGKAK